MGFQGIGASVRRKEDVRFLSGKGNYTDDINRPGQLYAVIKRSDRPHATINGIDTAAAAAAPGVVRVFVGADLAAESSRPDNCFCVSREAITGPVLQADMKVSSSLKRHPANPAREHVASHHSY